MENNLKTNNMDNMQDTISEAQNNIETTEERGSCVDHETQIQQLQQQFEEAQQQANAYKDQLLRALAEAENIRARMAKEREEIHKFAISDFARELLNVADNLNRTLANIIDTGEPEKLLNSLREGVSMTQTELLSILAKFNVTPINPQHQAFNPSFHQAIAEKESSEFPSGTVIEVLQIGYIINERLLRPALVVVAKEAS